MYLFLTEQGSKISIEKGKVSVNSGTLRREFPKELVDSVVIFGNISVTTPFLRYALTRNIPISFFSTTGEYFGRLSSTTQSNIKRLTKQLELIKSEAFYLPLSYKIIEAKINNQITVIRRYRKYSSSDIEKKINAIVNMKEKASKVNSIEELMGIEGYCAKMYFECLSEIVPEEFKFSKRTRRPPKDEFNSLISLGYTMLMHEIFGQIESVNLNPYGGFLHKVSEKFPSLVTDLLEEWRAPLVDSMSLNILINRKIRKEHFIRYEDKEGIFLTKEGLKIFISELSRKLDTKINYMSYLKKPISFRKAIYHQCKRIMQAFDNTDYNLYEPLRIR